jgi:hypothetical protein
VRKDFRIAKAKNVRGRTRKPPRTSQRRFSLQVLRARSDRRRLSRRRSARAGGLQEGSNAHPHSPTPPKPDLEEEYLGGCAVAREVASNGRRRVRAGRARLPAVKNAKTKTRPSLERRVARLLLDADHEQSPGRRRPPRTQGALPEIKPCLCRGGDARRDGLATRAIGIPELKQAPPRAAHFLRPDGPPFRRRLGGNCRKRLVEDGSIPPEAQRKGPRKKWRMKLFTSNQLNEECHEPLQKGASTRGLGFA